jgi:RNA polymerase sigma factor (sigma-70 family)
MKTGEVMNIESAAGDSRSRGSESPATTELVIHESFDAFYQREFRRLAVLAAAVAGDRSSAEDIAQEALTRAHRRWDSVGVMDKPGAWARRVTINLASSQRHRRTIELKAKLRLGARREPTLPATADPDNEVWAAVKALPGNQRAAMALRYLEDRTIEEIAEILECAPSTARVHLHRGRAALAENFGGSQ